MKEPPLLLIHGYPFDHTLWFSTIASLGSNARVIAPDLPGFGKNPVIANRKPSMQCYADYLARLLEESGYESAVVAGMSMGGYVALAFAAKYPARLAGLGLISSQTAADSPEVRQGRINMIAKIREQGPSAAADAILPKLFATDKEKSDLKEYPIKGANAAGVDGLCWALEAMAKRSDHTATLQALTVPVLILHGSSDRIVPGQNARKLAEQCHHPILSELPGVGHASPLEAPDQVASALARLMTEAVESQCREQAPEAADFDGSTG